MALAACHRRDRALRRRRRDRRPPAGGSRTRSRSRWRCSGCCGSPLALVAGEGALTAALDLAAALAVFALGALAFHFGLLGGGDVKLLAAGALWLGAAALGPYLMVTVLAGGAAGGRSSSPGTWSHAGRRDRPAQPALRGRDRGRRHPDHRRRALDLTAGGGQAASSSTKRTPVISMARKRTSASRARPVLDAELEAVRQPQPLVDLAAWRRRSRGRAPRSRCVL